MKRRWTPPEELKQTVNYGTGSGTCEKCNEPIGKGVLRIGRFKMNEVHGRYGEAGGHMKYSHIECFRTRPIEAEGRASKWLSTVKTRFEGFDSLTKKDQDRILDLAKNGSVPSKPAVEAWTFLLCFQKHQSKVFENIPIECAYYIAQYVCKQPCPYLDPENAKKKAAAKKKRKNF